MRAWTSVVAVMATVAVVGEAGAQVPAPLAAECVKHRAAGVPMKTREARLTLDPAPKRFPPHSAVLTRLVECGFRGKALVGAREMWTLAVVSADLEGPGFDPGFPDLSPRYFLVCEGSLATSLPAFVPGLSLSRRANTFTLPCTHHFYPDASRNRSEARRVTGMNGYAVRDAALSVMDGLAPGDDSFELRVEAEVASPAETLRLRGRVAGELSGGLRVFECGERRPGTKPLVPEVCEGPGGVARPPPPPPRPPKPPPPSRLRYYQTCGDNVCSSAGYRGPFPGVSPCAGKKEGQPCSTAGEQCDQANNCNTLLVCAAADPSTRCAR